MRRGAVRCGGVVQRCAVRCDACDDVRCGAVWCIAVYRVGGGVYLPADVERVLRRGHQVKRHDATSQDTVSGTEHCERDRTL